MTHHPEPHYNQPYLFDTGRLTYDSEDSEWFGRAIEDERVGRDRVAGPGDAGGACGDRFVHGNGFKDGKYVVFGIVERALRLPSREPRFNLGHWLAPYHPHYPDNPPPSAMPRPGSTIGKAPHDREFAH